MKKVFALLPLSLVLAACASGPVYKAPVGHSTAPVQKAYDRMMPEQFTCQDNGMVQAKYSVDGQQATITASLPKVQWTNQTVVLDTAVSGSGARYVNNVSPQVAYEWHTKGDTGIMSITWDDGTEYTVTCERN